MSFSSKGRISFSRFGVLQWPAVYESPLSGSTSEKWQTDLNLRLSIHVVNR